MGVGRMYLLSSILVVTILLAFNSVDSAYAVDYVVEDETSCKGLPGMGPEEIWDDTTLTCTKIFHLNIGTADTLTIPDGVTLVFPASFQLENKGVVINNGIINFTIGGIITNLDLATFTNSGTLDLNSTLMGDGILRNRHDATFTNTDSGIIILDGVTGSRGLLENNNDAIFTNFGLILIDGTEDSTGRLVNQDDAIFTNFGTVIVTGMNDFSGLIMNLSVLINSGLLTTNYNFDNNDPDSVLTNSGSIQITFDLDNTEGLITNDCVSEITFSNIHGNEIQEETYCPVSLNSGAYEDPTIGKSGDGRQMVENGICIDIRCWTVTARYHQDFKLVEMLSDSTHTISTTVFCQHGVNKCNYVAFGVSPYGTNIGNSVWKIILQKDHRDNWTMTVIDPDGYLGEVTSTTQIVNDARYLSASATIEFKKPTPGMILNVEVRDSGGGYRDFKFNDGVTIVDAYAYPFVEPSYDPPLEIKPLCHNENPNKRYTCAFDKVKDWTIKNAELMLKQMNY